MNYTKKSFSVAMPAGKNFADRWEQTFGKKTTRLEPVLEIGDCRPRDIFTHELITDPVRLAAIEKANSQPVTYVVRIKDTKTGEVRVMPETLDWGIEKGGSYFWWTEGNYGCDCNRGMEFDRAGGVPEEEVQEREYPCNTGVKRYQVLEATFPDGSEIVIDGDLPTEPFVRDH